jgi:hypothetical protein
MRVRSTLVALTALATAAVLALPWSAGAVGGSPISTDMVGAEEAPGPGDPDASGHASFTLNQGQGTICFDLTWADIDGTVIAAHIHPAPAGAPGPVAVPLFMGTTFAGTDSASGCNTDVDPALVKDIRKNPENYYVNVHSSAFLPGAIRGQLG